MKNFKVTVNGTAYDVCVEEISGGVVSAPVAPPPAAAAKPAQTAAGGEKVLSPLPGTVLDIKVSVGQKVEKNQIIAILEAMKMENEIVTPNAGTVSAVHVSKGQAVVSGDTLVTIS
ncbi:biotin carboxyl carrier protein [Clostridia bacterium]|nr:biotin carboxyl carrier protein [Clostridia bacterium]GHU75981.1 biotin carboxyl carrier protein [Clostridia bacterium]